MVRFKLQTCHGSPVRVHSFNSHQNKTIDSDKQIWFRMQLFSSKNSLRRGSFAIFIEELCACVCVWQKQSNTTATTYDMRNADDDDDVIDAFFGTKAAGAKAVADAKKNVVAAMENFMMLLRRFVCTRWCVGRVHQAIYQEICVCCKRNTKLICRPSKILNPAQYPLPTFGTSAITMRCRNATRYSDSLEENSRCQHDCSWLQLSLIHIRAWTQNNIQHYTHIHTHQHSNLL